MFTVREEGRRTRAKRAIRNETKEKPTRLFSKRVLDPGCNIGPISAAGFSQYDKAKAKSQDFRSWAQASSWRSSVCFKPHFRTRGAVLLL